MRKILVALRSVFCLNAKTEIEWKTSDLLIILASLSVSKIVDFFYG